MNDVEINEGDAENNLEAAFVFCGTNKSHSYAREN